MHSSADYRVGRTGVLSTICNHAIVSSCGKLDRIYVINYLVLTAVRGLHLGRMEAHMARNRTLIGLLLGTCCAALMVTPASAAVISSTTLVDFTGGSVSFGFNGTDIVFGPDQAFTFSDNGDSTSNVDVMTRGSSQVSAFGGFLGIPLVPSSYFNSVRGSGSLEFGPTTFGQLASFSTPTAIGASVRGFYIELTETLSDGTHYGYGQFADGGTILQSVAFESVAGRNIVTPVPLPASAPMFGAAVLALGLAGYSVKRKKAAAAA